MNAPYCRSSLQRVIRNVRLDASNTSVGIVNLGGLPNGQGDRWNFLVRCRKVSRSPSLTGHRCSGVKRGNSHKHEEHGGRNVRVRGLARIAAIRDSDWF